MSLTDAKPTLYEDLLSIFEDEAKAQEAPEKSRERIAQKMTEAIDKFVRAGEIQVEAGISVSTSGGSGATTGKGMGKMI